MCFIDLKLSNSYINGKKIIDTIESCNLTGTAITGDLLCQKKDSKEQQKLCNLCLGEKNI